MDGQEKLGRKDHIQNTWSRINSMVDTKQACGPDHSEKGFVDTSLVNSVPSTTKGLPGTFSAFVPAWSQTSIKEIQYLNIL